MNKKIYAGMIILGVAASFWACGSGEILDHTADDDYLGYMPEDDPDNTDGLNVAEMKKNCLECNVGESSSSSSKRDRPQRSSSSRPQPQSSSSVSSSSTPIIVNSSSSSSDGGHHRHSSSSSDPRIINSSSSSVPINNGNNGTCVATSITTQKPVVSVELGEKFYWKYTAGGEVSTLDVLKASFKWATPGATSETYERTGSYGTNDTVAYAISGPKSATLTLTKEKGGVYNISCGPVQVNGAPIRGCKCSTEATSVDYTATPNVSWTVSGCSTGAGLTLSYEWDGLPGDSVYTKTFDDEHPGYAPTLKVANNDNTLKEVTCPAVKLTYGPEYKITTTQGAGAIKLPKGSSNVVLMVDAYNNTVFCNVSRDDSPSGALNGTVSKAGSVSKVALKGGDYITATMPAGTLVTGTSLEFVLDVPATCGIQ